MHLSPMRQGNGTTTLEYILADAVKGITDYMHYDPAVMPLATR